MLQIIKNRKMYYIIEIVIFLFAALAIIFTEPNLGIDMTGGTQIEYTYTDKNFDIEKARMDVEDIAKNFRIENNLVINSTQVYKIAGEDKFAIIAGFNSSNQSETEQEEYKLQFRNDIGKKLIETDASIKESQYVNVGKSFGDYIKSTAILTLTLAIIGIAVYVSYAFSGVISGINSLSFSSITIVTLFHDVFVAAGLFVFCSIFFKEFQIDTFFVTALLTILGYSINDTIVVFDRIRTNLEKVRKNEKIDLKKVIDTAINETFTRSIYTSMTLFIVLVTIFVFGPESIKGFILVMIFGTVVGTYSSIFIAAPLLYDINKNKELKYIEKKAYNPDSKIVV